MSTGTLTDTVARARHSFHQRYGRMPRWVAAAPGRVNIIGEHVDYNDGFVLPMAIERYCVIAADATDSSAEPARDKSRDHPSSTAQLYSSATNETASIDLTNPRRHPTPGHWSNYFAGVIAGCLEREMRPGAFVAAVESSVPVGGGLSSSASIEVATATLIEAITGVTLDPVDKALLCQRAEHVFAGVPCGIMDQFASTMCRADHLMLLDCRSRQIEHIPLVDPSITVLIINTNVKHELSGGEYAERRGQCESAARKLGVGSLRDVTVKELEARESMLDAIEFRRARHAVSEIARTVEATSGVKAGEWPVVGRLMYASHASLRDDFEVSCAELDLLVELAHGIGPAGGVFGSRMTGGGFGGCTVSLLETGKVSSVADSLAKSYRAKTGIEPSILTSRPARGAHIIETV
jgi:galactokinase